MASSFSVALMQEKERPPPSFAWRAYHSGLFNLAALGFFAASPLFFPAAYALHGAPTAAGYLYTLGSALFLVADLTEWWFLRVGDVGNDYNFFFSVCGSASYLVGSSFLIPTAFHLFWGNAIFVIGSGIIILSQAAKLARGGSAMDRPAVVVDALTLGGGFWYLTGSCCGCGLTWNGSFCTGAAVAVQYTLGGFCFASASFAIIYRYFFSTSMPEPAGPTPFGPLFPSLRY